MNWKPLLALSIFLSVSVTCQTITTVAGTGTSGYSGDGGPALNGEIATPTGMSFDHLGNYYIGEAVNCVVRQVKINDSLYTVAGTGTWNYNGDNIPATTANLCPLSVTFDRDGNMIISDQPNHRIRLVNSQGIITTICGTGTIGNSGDGAAATQAQIWCPGTIALDKSSNILFTDFCNNNARKIDTNGIIITIAGNGSSGFSGDGGLAIAAQLNGPYSIIPDRWGNYFIADQFNNRIRKIDASGKISTVAGIGNAGYSGDGGQAVLAELNHPAQLALDSIGNLFFADYYNSVVRKIDTSGIITTVAGTGTVGYSGDNGPATSAHISHAWGVALNQNGDLYIADQGNNVIRKVTNLGVMSSKMNASDVKVTLYPDPVSEILNVEAKNLNEIKLFDILGKDVLSSKEKQLDISCLENGIYLARIKTLQGIATQKVVVQH